MTTLDGIRRAAETPVATYTDSTTPPGHFVATTKVLGIPTDYLCAGAESDPDAPIVGRIEWQQPPASPNVYCGNGLKGGQWIRSTTGTAEAFAAMVATAESGTDR